MQARLVLAVLAAALASTGRADTGTLEVSAVVLSKSNCIVTSGNTLTLAFGQIDPTSTADAPATATASIRCNGSADFATFAITLGPGNHSSAADARRMQHGQVATEFLPYSLEATPAAATIAKGATQLITISGTITPAQFQNARVGFYSDTVRITLTP